MRDTRRVQGKIDRELPEFSGRPRGPGGTGISTLSLLSGSANPTTFRGAITRKANSATGWTGGNLRKLPKASFFAAVFRTLLGADLLLDRKRRIPFGKYFLPKRKISVKDMVLGIDFLSRWLAIGMAIVNWRRNPDAIKGYLGKTGKMPRQHLIKDKKPPLWTRARGQGSTCRSGE